ncbi:MAG: D-Ala-D-Ala carboxypeptidase family metallohydrolase, partial [Waterburya sp.]
MGDFTQNLSRVEFKCQCGCGFDTVDFSLVTALQTTVYHFQKKYDQDVRIKITSGCRCPAHNKKVGGAT